MRWWNDVLKTYEPRKSPTDMARCYQASDILVMPSLGETFGLVSAEGELNYPFDLAVDAAHGGVYVTDAENNRIEKFDTSGNFVSAWGWGVDDGSAAYQVCTQDCQAGSEGSDGRVGS